MSAQASKKDEALLARSAGALQALGGKDSGQPDDVAEATDALVELLARVSCARETRGEVANAEQELVARNEKAVNALQLVDQEIITAKIDAVQTFEERDQIARNLSRARATLSEIETAEHAESNDEALGLADELVRSDTLVQRLQEVEELEKQVAEALERVDVVEGELLAVAEETDRVRSRRKNLEEKLSAAQGEW